LNGGGDGLKGSVAKPMDENPYRSPQAEGQKESRRKRIVRLLSSVGIAGMLIAVAIILTVGKEHAWAVPLFIVSSYLAAGSITFDVVMSKLRRS
jgi:hypothetical protein